MAYDFLGRTATYRELLAEIDRCADGLAALGLGPRDRMTISMPTSPQGVPTFHGCVAHCIEIPGASGRGPAEDVARQGPAEAIVLVLSRRSAGEDEAPSEAASRMH